MKDGALVAESLLVGAEGAEILRCLGHHVRSQQDDDPAHHLVADLDVQVDLGHSGDRVKLLKWGCSITKTSTLFR